jgi:excisionase family DNA binding protein
MQTDTPWLTTVEAASYLKMSPRSIRAAFRENKLRHVQPGGERGKILTRREWLDAWVGHHAQGGDQ